MMKKLLGLLYEKHKAHHEVAGPLLERVSLTGLFVFPLLYAVRFIGVLPIRYDDWKLRLVGMVLCFFLATKKWWPEKLRPYYLGYSYLPILYCLPFFMSYTTLLNKGDTPSVVNMMVGAIVLILVTDWRNALLIMLSGYGLGTLAYSVFHPAIQFSSAFIVWWIPLSGVVVVVGSLFKVSEERIAKERARVNEVTALAGSIAHEIGTPLGQVKYSLDEIAQLLPIEANATPHATTLNPQQTQALYQHLHRGQTSLQRTFQIIEMTLSQVGGKPLDASQFEYLSAATTTQKALDEYSFDSAEQRERVSLNVVHDFQFKGHETAYVFVLFNLIKNALYYFSSHPQARLTITVDAPFVRVRDTGPGIPAEVLPRLFDAFVSAGKSGGTGLGLAYCKRTMRAFGGDIRGESVPGQFTEFALRFVLPSAQELAEHEEQLLQAARSALAGLRVLVVDDQAHMRRFTCEILQAQGLLVDEAADGPTALRLLQQQPYDLVLTDLMMPRMDGYELAQAIRQSAHPGLADVALLAYSSESPATAAIKSTRVGINGFLPKSQGLPPLLLAMQKALQAAQTQGQTRMAALKLQGTTLLVADDNPINRQMLAALLAPLQVRCLQAANGLEVLDILALHPEVKALLLDENMPGMGGIETTKRLRGMGSQLPIVGLSAHVDEAHKTAALQAGMNAWLIKPVTPSTLHRCLGDLLHKPASGASPAFSEPTPPPTPASAQQERPAIQRPLPLPESELQARDAASPQGVPLLNLAHLDSLRDINHHWLIESELEYLEQMHTRLQHDLPRCLAQRDMNALQDLMHRFLGDAGNAGLMALHQYTRDLYLPIHQGLWPEPEQWLEHLQDLFLLSKQALLKAHLAPHYMQQYVPSSAL